ncbi:unnamed protein product [Mytilus edulis]|uniref:Uncharacterized protein n=1 Tax=Mytilus edulis TaxID=6550 RepID=A0A8S3Q2M9_MYTED|nr:unnamed protein product [Mytilus edulis]
MPCNSKICLSFSRAADITQEQMLHVQRSAYPSRATDITQEQMLHVQQDLLILKPDFSEQMPHVQQDDLLISIRTDATCKNSKEQMPHVQQDYPSRTTDICCQQDLLIRCHITDAKNRCHTARSAYPSKTTDFSQEQMPAHPSRTTDIRTDATCTARCLSFKSYLISHKNRCHVQQDLLMFQELLISHKNRCFMYSKICIYPLKATDITRTDATSRSAVFLELLILIRTDATCTARVQASIPSRATDISKNRCHMYSKICFPSRATGYLTRTDATCTARSAFLQELLIPRQEQMPHVQQDSLSRTTDISQEQMPHNYMYSKILITRTDLTRTDVQQDLLILQELLILTRTDATCTARSAYPSRTTDITQEQMPHVQQDLLMFLELLISHKNRCHITDATCTADLYPSRAKYHWNRCHMCSGSASSLGATDITQTDAMCNERSQLFLELLISQEQMPHEQQDLLISPRLLISHKVDATCAVDHLSTKNCSISQEQMPHNRCTCTARSAYVSRTTDFSQEQMPHEQQDLLILQELLILIRTTTARSAYLKSIDISQEDATSRSAYPSRATDTSQEQMPHASKICLSFKNTDIQEQMPHVQQAYVSRTTDFSQEQMPHVQQDLLMISHKNRY